MALSVVPGVLLHGSGHVAAGQSQTAYRLLLAEGIGLSMVLVGGGVLAATGAARNLVGPAAVVTISGVGLFGISWFADIYGVSTPDSVRGEAPPRVYHRAEIGVMRVSDPQFDYEWFSVLGADYWLGDFRLAPRGWFSLGHANERLRLGALYRAAGPSPSQSLTPAPAGADGSLVDVEAAVTRHAFPPERFETTTAELSVTGRLDLQQVGPSLRGAFAEMGTGAAVSHISYDVSGVDGENTELLLFTMGFGAYLGRGNGELKLYYDHRHDDFAAGLIVPGLGSGVAGHFGFHGEYFFCSGLGVSADAQAGSAYILGTSLLYRGGL